MVHTNGDKLIAVGGNDKKVRLISAETGRDVDPTISGHAGSVRCVALCEKKGFVLSGSYDTSIRGDDLLKVVFWEVQCRLLQPGFPGLISAFSVADIYIYTVTIVVI